MSSLPDLVPLVIGVTGHRDLRIQDASTLEREVGAIITRLRRDYLSDNSETPLILLSALAEGADQIVADVALKHGVRLIAPLPMPPDEYRRDLEPGLVSGAALKFDQLLSQAIAAPVVPFTTGNSLEGVRADKNKRAEQYRAVGLFIVQHSDVLIALWDGNENDRAIGGTTEVVTFKRQGIPLVVSGSAHASLDGSEIGPVIHVLTPRNNTGSTASEVAVRAWGNDIIKRHRGNAIQRLFGRIAEFCVQLFGIELKSVTSRLRPEDKREFEAWETFSLLTTLTRKFNSDAAALAATVDGRRRTAQSIDHLFSDFSNARLDQGARQRALSSAPHWCHLYGIADTLAQRLQLQFKCDWLLMFVFSVIAFVFFALIAHVNLATNEILIAYAVFVAIIYCVFIRARVMRHQELFLDYRALAEALRVAVFWNILGIDRNWSDSVAAPGRNYRADTINLLAGSYPIQQPSELAWVKICLRTLERLHGSGGNSATQKLDPEAHSIARRFWVHGQLLYFGRQGPLHNRRAAVLEGWALLFLSVTPFLLMPLLLAVIGENQWLGVSLHKIFLIAIGILPGLAALLAGYSERLALKAQARQYDRMRMLFERAYELLPKTLDGSSMHLVRSLYRELGVEAMTENAEWVAIYRQRPIQPVQ
jgi:hypothetical protein